MEANNDKGKGSTKKRLRKRKSLEFDGWGSRNLIEFLQSLGKDTTERISENDVTNIIMDYILEKNRDNPSNKKKRRKIVACDEKLHSLFGSQKINTIKVPNLVEKHYIENQEDSFFDDIFSLEDNDKQHRFLPSDKVAGQKKEVVQKPKGIFAAIVRDNIKLLYLRKSLVQELAKTPETFENKVVGTFVRIKNPCQLVQVTGVKEGNLIDGYILQVTNYSYYLKDYTTSGLSDDDFSREECEELHQRMNGFAKRLTVVDMEEKARSLHEDVTKHWIAKELVLLQRLVDQANEKGWRRELSQYLEKRELLQNPEEQLRLLREVPEVVAEELEPECILDDGRLENDLTITKPEACIEANQSEEKQQTIDSPVSTVHITPKAAIEGNQSDEEQHPSDSPVFSAQKTPEASIEANQSEEEQEPCKSPVSTVHRTPKASIEGNQSDEEQYPSDSPVCCAQKTPEASTEANQSEEEQEPCNSPVSTVHTPKASIEANQSEEEEPQSDSPVSTVQKTLENSKLCDGKDQPAGKIPAGNEKDFYVDLEEQPANEITQNKDSNTEGDINTKVSKIPVIDLSNEPQAQSKPLEMIELSDDGDEEDKDNQAQSKPLEIIELSDDDEEEDKDNQAHQHYDPEKVMWFYEYPKGIIQGPFSLRDLKEWSDAEFYIDIPYFKVWKTGEKQELCSATFQTSTTYQNINLVGKRTWNGLECSL